MDLISIFQNVNGASFVTITTETVLPLLGGRANPMKDRVKKITTGTSVMVFQNKNKNGYKAMVNRRLEREGKNVEFELSPRKWGTRLPELPIVDHEGQLYLEVIVLKDGVVHYELDGKVIAESEIRGMKPEAEKAEQGGLDDKVVIKCYKGSSIRSVTVDKQTYTFRS